MRSLILVLAAAGCAAPSPGDFERRLGDSLHRLGRRIERGFVRDNPGRFAVLDQRPMLIDLRNAILRLPATLRLDVAPFPDHHAALRVADASGEWQPQRIVARALGRLLP